ncbi:hypothetical protein [Mucilaginibacter metallidurans]|uniref:hypothetical protein n=1 Tax=Mucilaginibacter sp. P4 TaxID=3383180 RepID=UPI001FCAD06A|nr:hypothetical protein [Mucilaginibacter gossypii]
MVICQQEIPGITGGAIDSKEGEPGPLLIQGITDLSITETSSLLRQNKLPKVYY